MCSKLTIKTSKRHQWRRSKVFIVNFEQILHIALVLPVLVFPFLTLNKKYWLRVNKCSKLTNLCKVNFIHCFTVDKHLNKKNNVYRHCFHVFFATLEGVSPQTTTSNFYHNLSCGQISLQSLSIVHQILDGIFIPSMML